MASNDDPPQLPPPPSMRPSLEFARGFVEAHRQRIFLGLSVAGTGLLGPFAINNFFQGRVLLGIATSTFVVCLLANAFAIARGRKPLVPATAIFAASVVGLATAMYNQGLIGVLWVYPGILLFHFMMPRRRANVFNFTLVVLTVPLAWMHLGPQLTARVVVTLVLLVIFANIFSHIANAQQVKEAEQRTRLDALVRQLEAQNTALREAFRLREEVERIARHDLKTPLASIASVPRLLRERHAPDAQEAELLRMVEGAALRVLSMVNLSLDLFRMEEGTYPLRAQAVDLGALAGVVTRDLQAHALSKNLRLVVDLPPRALYAQGEELLCYSILANLLKNALEASPEGAQVRVALGRARGEGEGEGEGEDAVLLEIHNQGDVPAEVRQTFFDKYSTWGKPGGTGLGTYSARLMARVQKGSLDMRCGDGGTTLALRLPRWRGAVPARPKQDAPLPSAHDPAPALPPRSVLVVDDDEYNVVVLRNLLPSPPMTVRTAVNGRAALEWVREARPDVIFMDVEMPVMGGIEAVEAIRVLQRERGEPPSTIAAFSAYDDEATRQRCLAAGFDLYLAKPASREEVDAVLRGRDPAEAPSSGGMPLSAPAPLPSADGCVWIESWMVPLMPEFLASRRELVRALADAITAGEQEAIRTTAHKLAGSLSMYGFKAASRASRQLEDAVATEDLGALRARCDALEAMLARAETVVRPAA